MATIVGSNVNLADTAITRRKSAATRAAVAALVEAPAEAAVHHQIGDVADIARAEVGVEVAIGNTTKVAVESIARRRSESATMIVATAGDMTAQAKLLKMIVADADVTVPTKEINIDQSIDTTVTHPTNGGTIKNVLNTKSITRGGSGVGAVAR